MYSRKKVLRKTRKKKMQEAGKKLLWKIGAGVLGCVLLLGVLAWQSGNEKFTISEVVILGNEAVYKADISTAVENELSGKYMWSFYKKNIFIYPKEEIKKILLGTYKRIEEVNIERETFNKIVVEISERKPKFLYCVSPEEVTGADKKCFFVDRNGYIFAVAPHFSGPVFFEFYGEREFSNDPIGNSFFEKNEFEVITAFKEEVEKIGLKPVALREIKDDGIMLMLEDGTKIIFNKMQNLSSVLENLGSSIEVIEVNKKKLEYIDLRFGNKVFYKYVE